MLQLPLPIAYLILTAAVLLSIGAGFSLGKYVRRNSKAGKNPSLGSVIGAVLALLGFILALTFSMVSSRFSERKQLVLDEANAIGTAILRTDLLDEPFRAESRSLLGEYVDIRASFGKDPEAVDVPQAIVDSEEIQDRLWLLATQNLEIAKSPALLALYLRSLNEVFDIHSLRYNQGVQYRLSRGVWFLLYFVTALSMVAVGFEFGVNESGSLLGALILALIFAAIVVVISDLDRGADSSFIKVSQQPMLDLQQKLRSSGD